MTSEKLSRAVQLIKSGNTVAALPILKEVLQAEPNNENAWLWLYASVEQVEQKKYCLRQALRVNPKNQDAHNALLKLENLASATPLAMNPEVDTASRPTINGHANEKKRLVKESRISVQALLVGLLTIGVFCLVATLFLLIVQRNSFFANIFPLLSRARFENVTGNPLSYPEAATFEYMMNNPPTPINDITLKIRYPAEMSQGETVQLLVTCVNNSNQPIENLRVVIWGKSSDLGMDVNYFEGINVSTTDRQFIDAGNQINGLYAYFDTGIINAGETKEGSINIAALTVGGYRGEVHIVLDIPGRGITSYETKILTSVNND